MPKLSAIRDTAKTSHTAAVRFIHRDIWRIRLADEPPVKRTAVRALRVLTLAVRGFKQDAGPLWASSLTFYTLLSIVPVAAMAFGIAKGFGFQQMLEEQIYETFPGQEEIAARVLVFAQSLLETTKGGIIAGIGLVLLFWAVIKVLGNIEQAFNSIWKVRKPRSLTRKFTDYSSIMLISPLLVILQSSATVFITTRINRIADEIALIGYFSPLITLLFQLIPFVIVWVLFTLLYIIIPNRRVAFSSALTAGIIAGTGYQVFQWLYIVLQVGASRYNAIYGSFAALPLFLVWLQISWTIVLFGAEIAFAAQHATDFEFEAETAQASPALRKLVALEVCRLVVRTFVDGGPPLTAADIAAALQRPLRLTHRVLGELVASGILIEVRLEGSEARTFVPARDVEQLTLGSIIEALEAQGLSELPPLHGEESSDLVRALAQLRESLRQSPGNRKIKEI